MRFVVNQKRTGEYRTRRIWLGLGKKVVEERVVEQIFSVSDDPTGRGEQWSEDKWVRVNKTQ